MRRLISYLFADGPGRRRLLSDHVSHHAPQKIPMDRRNYIDNVSTSWKEQLLNNLVGLRYGNTLTSLEMTSVNTAYELDAGLSAGYPVNWHPLQGTSGFRNVVAVGGSVGYQDKPTITYAPMRGEALANTLLMRRYRYLKF